MIHYIDDYGYYHGDISELVICDENREKCVPVEFPADALADGYNWVWINEVWVQAVDNRLATWYDPINTSMVFKASSPTQPPPSGFIKWIPGVAVDPAISNVKDKKWAEIKQARTQAEYFGFTWDGSAFDSNAVSQQRITGAVTLAQLSNTFSIDWILADNTVRTLSSTEMMQVGVALGAHVATQFSKAQSLRSQIEAASTVGEVEALCW